MGGQGLCSVTAKLFHKIFKHLMVLWLSFFFAASCTFLCAENDFYSTLPVSITIQLLAIIIFLSNFVTVLLESIESTDRQV